MKRKGKPEIIDLRPHYTTHHYSATDAETVEQVFDGETFVGALVTPKSGGKIRLLKGAEGQRSLTRIQNAAYAALKR